MTDDDRVVLLSVAVPRAPGVRLGVLRVWPVDPRADLGPLLYTSLTDDEIVAVLRRLARGEEPGVDLEAHRLDEAEWRRRREARGRALPPLGGGDVDRRRRRRARKRRGRRR